MGCQGFGAGQKVGRLAMRRIDELESLRGIAALLVVFFHMPKWHPALQNPLFDNAYLMVELFFVLSGFVIQTAYGDALRTGAEVLRFQFLRLARLYPVHLLFLIVFLGIEIAKWLIVTRGGVDDPATAPFAVNDLRAFVENLLLWNGALPDRAFTFNYPSWSISVEFWTYLVFALTVLWLRAWRLAMFGLLAAGALALLVSGATGDFDNLLKCLAGFFLGCLTAAFTSRVRPRLPALTVPLAFAAMLAFLLVKPSHSGDLAVFPLSVLLVLALVASREGGVSRVLRHPRLVWLGTVSYPVYMSHAAVLWVANQIVRFTTDGPEAADASGRLIPQMPLGLTVLAALAVLAVVLAVSAVVHLWVERPFRERSRRAHLVRRAEAGLASR